MTHTSMISHRELSTWLLVLVAGGAAGLERNAPRVDDFMTYDAAQRTVQLTVVARYDGSNIGYNLNGGFQGSHVITVPLGWRVHTTFINRDVVPHSLGLVRQTKLLPTRIGKPAIAGAASRRLQSGIAGNDRDEFEFVAAQSGPYFLACGVAGHAAIGSYLRFVISADAASPVYETDRTIARRPVGH